MKKKTDQIKDFKKKLDSISPTFCAAKWLQVTLHLQNGHGHSCHHPDTHKISEREIEKDPRALHNSQYKAIQRESMLSGERPAECSYCWNIEDADGNHLSDRYIKSSSDWAKPHIN